LALIRLICSLWGSYEPKTPEHGVTTPTNPLFFDNFNYVGNTAAAFLNAGWDGIKTISYTRPGARGEIFTDNGVLRMPTTISEDLTISLDNFVIY
jgi:hypothetical protein